MKNPYDTLFFAFYTSTSEKDPYGRSRQARAMMKLLILLLVNGFSIAYVMAPIASNYFGLPISKVTKILIAFLSITMFGYGFWKVIFANNYERILAKFKHASKSDTQWYSYIKVFYIMATVIFFLFSGLFL